MLKKSGFSKATEVHSSHSLIYQLCDLEHITFPSWASISGPLNPQKYCCQLKEMMYLEARGKQCLFAFPADQSLCFVQSSLTSTQNSACKTEGMQNTCGTNDFLNHSLYLELSEARIILTHKRLKYLTLLFSSTNSISPTVFFKEEDLVWSIIIFIFYNFKTDPSYAIRKKKRKP